jgi:hypothetical protein
MIVLHKPCRHDVLGLRWQFCDKKFKRVRDRTFNSAIQRAGRTSYVVFMRNELQFRTAPFSKRRAEMRRASKCQTHGSNRIEAGNRGEIG